MEHVQVHDIPNFETLRSEVMSHIPMLDKTIYGDYDVHKKPHKWFASNKPYYMTVQRMIDEACNKYCVSWGCTTWTLNTMWYHVYNKGGTYSNHTHTLANMAGVLHLVLEDDRDCTDVMGFDKPIKEGQVILFPSMHPHRSPVVHGSKIVIGFNWDIYHDMKEHEEVEKI